MAAVKLRSAAVLLLLAAAPAAAGEIRGACEIAFVGSSTLHDFSGTGTCRPFSAVLVREGDGRTVLPRVDVEVPVDGLKTGIDARDRRMREMFRSDRYPMIRVSVRDLDAGAFRERMRKAAGGTVPLDVSLSIGAVEKTVPAAAGNLKEDGDRITFDVELPVSLKAFDLSAPTVLLFVRVADRVVVKGHIALDVLPDP
jgi:YceI-like domain